MAVLTEEKIKSIISNFIENADEKDLKEMSEQIDIKTTENFWKNFEEQMEKPKKETFIWPVF